MALIKLDKYLVNPDHIVTVEERSGSRTGRSGIYITFSNDKSIVIEHWTFSQFLIGLKKAKT